MKPVCRVGMLGSVSSTEPSVSGLRIMGRTCPAVLVCMCGCTDPFLTIDIPDFQFSDHWRQDLYTNRFFLGFSELILHPNSAPGDVLIRKAFPTALRCKHDY